MGQRLNIEIIENGVVLANAYYHWSGYTSYALTLTEKILKKMKFKYIKDIKNSTLKAIRLLETTNAGLPEIEYEFIPENLKTETFNKVIDRNEGLIAISEKGIQETQYWQEARIGIHLDSNEIDLDISNISIENDFDKEELKNMTKTKYDYTETTFEEFFKIKKQILAYINKEIYQVYNPKENIVYSFIE